MPQWVGSLGPHAGIGRPPRPFAMVALVAGAAAELAARPANTMERASTRTRGAFIGTTPWQVGANPEKQFLHPFSASHRSSRCFQLKAGQGTMPLLSNT